MHLRAWFVRIWGNRSYLIVITNVTSLGDIKDDTLLQVSVVLTWCHPANFNGSVIDAVHCHSSCFRWSPTKCCHFFRRFTGHNSKVILHRDGILICGEESEATVLKECVCSYVDT